MKVLNIWKKQILDLIYPPRCPICHEIVEAGCEMICNVCMQKLPVISEKCCKKCGKPIDVKEEYCADCLRYEHEYDQGMGIFLYNDLMRTSIAHFKYKGRQEYGIFFGRAAWKYGRVTLCKWNPEILIPVPVHNSKKVERGFNQAEIIARVLGQQMNRPVVSNAVFRIEKTKAQKELSPEQRRENLQHAFKSGQNPFPWKRVLLVDDIYTTGSTVDAISCVLKQSGAQEIYVLSICIGSGFMVQ